MNRFWKWFTIVLFILIVGFGVWYFLLRNQESEKVEDFAVNTVINQTTSTNFEGPTVVEKTTTTTSAPEIIETTTTENIYADWETYTNEEIGYQLMYPEGWIISETDTFDERMETDVKYINITTDDEKWFLHFGIKTDEQDFANTDRSGTGAGEFEDFIDGKTTIVGIETTPEALVYNDKIKELYYNQPENSNEKCKCNFTAVFSYNDPLKYEDLDLNGSEYIDMVVNILNSVEWKS